MAKKEPTRSAFYELTSKDITTILEAVATLLDSVRVHGNILKDVLVYMDKSDKRWEKALKRLKEMKK